MLRLWLSNIIVAVPDRNRILICRVFQAHHQIWHSIALSFRLYAKCKHMNIWRVCEAHMNPALSRSLALSHVKLCDALEIRDGIIFNFYSGPPHMSYFSSKLHVHVRYLLFFFHSLLGNPSLPACATCTSPCGETTICGTLGGCNMDSSSRVLGWRWSRHSHSGELSSPKRWSQIRCVRKPALFVTVSLLVSCLHLYWESTFTA